MLNITVIPVATLVIMLIAVTVSFLNMVIKPPSDYSHMRVGRIQSNAERDI